MKLAGLIVSFLTSTSTTSAMAFTQAFEGLQAGTVVAGDSPFGGTIPGTIFPGMTLSVLSNRPDGSGVTDSLIVFDTAHPTGNDPDLGTPNQFFGGPGIGIGGQSGLGVNDRALGKVLVIAKYITDANSDGIVDDPNDEPLGGTITINWTHPQLVTSMTLVDIEEVAGTIVHTCTDNTTVLFVIPNYGDDSRVTVPVSAHCGVKKTMVSLAGSGSLAEVTYESPPVPIEPTTWSRIKALRR